MEAHRKACGSLSFARQSDTKHERRVPGFMKTHFAQGIWLLLVLGVAPLGVVPRGSAQSPPLLSVQVSNSAVRLRITGDVGSACTIQYRAGLSPTNHWQFLTNLTPLSSSPYLVLDAGAVTAPRFYRAFAQQVPANVVTTNMVWITPGTFVMGSPINEALRYWNETQHTVTLTTGLFMGKYPVTQAQYLSLLITNPSYFKTNNGYSQDLSRPVEQVSWIDATNYCARLTQQERLAGRIPTNWAYRLPTESEWEYACRAGTTTAFNFGNAIHGGMANFYDYQEYDAFFGDIYVANPVVPYLARTTAVGTYLPNAWGLYDMHGHLWEWCRDWYGGYPPGNISDPQGPVSGSLRVVRGGSWSDYGKDCRSAGRAVSYPSQGSILIGFRVVLAPGQP
jgi:formylglycine-generating enzyme